MRSGLRLLLGNAQVFHVQHFFIMDGRGDSASGFLRVGQESKAAFSISERWIAGGAGVSAKRRSGCVSTPRISRETFFRTDGKERRSCVLILRRADPRGTAPRGVFKTSGRFGDRMQPEGISARRKHFEQNPLRANVIHNSGHRKRQNNFAAESLLFGMHPLHFT